MPRFSYCIALFIVFAKAAACASTVPGNWQPSNIVKEMRAGTTSIQEVTFVPNATTSTAAKVHVSGEIGKYITITPSGLGGLAANTGVPILIQVTIPKGQRAKQVSGFVRITNLNDPDDDADDSTTLSKLPVTIVIKTPSVSEIPTEIALPSPDRLTVDPRLPNLQFASDEVDALFVSDATLDYVRTRAAALNVAFIGSESGLNYFQLISSNTGYDNLKGLIALLEADPMVAGATLHEIAAPFTIPNDPGTLASYAPALINLLQAWELTTGIRATPQGELGIGVIDGGFDFQHPDLVGNITARSTNSTDRLEHGTRVTSIVGASGNNAQGIAGVMWEASLHLYSAGLPSADGDDGTFVIHRIHQATVEHMRVVNLSLGFECNPCTDEQKANSQHDEKVFKRLFEAGKDTLWVIAAGNLRTDVQNSVPASLAGVLPNVIAVSGVDSSSQLFSFSPLRIGSDYGKAVTVAAPAKDIFSDIPGGGFDNGSVLLGNATGTSLAAPHVTGVAGLMLSLNPALTPSNVKNIIAGTAKHTGNFDPENNEVLLLDAFAAVQAAQASLRPVQYTITDLGANLNPRAVNAAGQVVGTIGFNRAFLWSNEVLADLTSTLPNAVFSEAVSINESGHIAGNYTTLSFPAEHAFLIAGTNVTDIGVPVGATGTLAAGIDSTDRIVGMADRTFHGVFGDPFQWTNGAFDSLVVGFPSNISAVSPSGKVTGRAANGLSQPGQAFLLDGTTLTLIGALPNNGGFGSFGFGVNENGQVVGQSGALSGLTNHPFLWSSSSGILDLGTLPGYIAGFAISINLKGEVVGESIDFNNVNPERAFIWTSARGLQDLNDLIPASGWVLDSVTAINDSGLIVGRGRLNGQPHGFLLTPVIQIALQ